MLLASCGGSGERDNDTSQTAPTGTELSRARALWDNRNVRSYRYLYAQASIGQVRVEVRDDVVVSAHRLPDNEPLDGEGLAYIFTINGLFDQVQGLLNNPELRTTVVFDEQFGFPQDTFYSSELPGVQDGFGGIYVKEFEPLP